MDPTYKVTFTFSDFFQTQGFVENWYVLGTDVNSAMAKADQIAQQRVGILAAGLSLSYIRLSGNLPEGATSPPRQRAAVLKRVDYNGSYKPSVDKADLVFVAAKVRYANNDGTVFRVQLMRGLSDELWSDGNDKIAQVAFKNFLPNFQQALQSNDFQIRHKNRAAPTVPIYTAINKAQYEALTRRATGRPLFLPRGRRAA